MGGEYPLSAAVTFESHAVTSTSSHLSLLILSLCFGTFLAPLMGLSCLILGVSADYTWRCCLGAGGILAVTGCVLRLTTMEETSAWKKAEALRRQATARSFMTPRQFFMKHVGDFGFTLSGTSISWFLFGFTCYGTASYTTTIMAGSTPEDTLLNVMGINLFSLPGALLLFVLRPRMKAMQLRGFFVMGVAFLGLAVLIQCGSPLIWKLLTFGVLGVFATFGPAATTFTIPAEVFPSSVRASCHGVSAASGKLGAFLGAYLFPQLMSVIGLPGVLVVCSGILFLGFALTLVLTPSYDADKLHSLKALEAAGGKPKQLSGILWAEDSSRASRSR